MPPPLSRTYTYLPSFLFGASTGSSLARATHSSEQAGEQNSTEGHVRGFEQTAQRRP